MAFTTSPKEYNRRLAAAIAFRNSTTYKEVMQGNDPVAVYKYNLGEQAITRPTTVKGRHGGKNSAIENLDVYTGMSLIKRGRFDCNVDRFEQVLNKHSPNAGFKRDLMSAWRTVRRQPTEPNVWSITLSINRNAVDIICL